VIFKQIKTRLLGFVSWIKLFVQIFLGRGKDSYGKEMIDYLVNKFRFEYLAEKNQYAEAQKLIAQVIQVCVPFQVYKLVRVGKATDSGYFMPESIEFDYLIAGGIGKNNDFEHFYASAGVTVVAFDPTVEKLPRPHKNIKHEKLWLRGETSYSSRTDDKDIQEVLSSIPSNIKVMLKLDVEGDEYSILDSLIGNFHKFEVILIEFHEMYKLSDLEFRVRIERILKNISQDFNAVSFKSNNWRNFVQFGNAFIPEVFEVVFINKKNMKFVKKGSRADLQNYETYSNNPKRLNVPDSPIIL
jgi:hypothetical protein